MEKENKLCGLLGGIAWPSSAQYYKMMNIKINQFYGGLASSRSIMYSLNLNEYSDYAYNDLEKYKQLLADAANALFKGGSEFLVICSNTAHLGLDIINDEFVRNYKAYPYFSHLPKAPAVPALHIIDSTIFYMKKTYPNIKKVGLIATIFTMKSDHIVKRLEAHGLQVAIPRMEEDQLKIMKIIEDELSKDICDNIESYNTIVNIINKMVEEDNIEGIILGCTELPLIIRDEKLKSGLPVFDTTNCHIDAAVLVQTGQMKLEDFYPS
jgi:aspartate racemase